MSADPTGPDDAHTPGGLADSAGLPWAGREFQENERSDDDGSADPRLVEAVRRFRNAELGPAEVIAAMREARLLVPLVAVAGDEGTGPFGQRIDKTQELSLVTVAGPDGRNVLPAFTSVQAMAVWNSMARPIPVEAARVALAAASEEAEAIILDPGSEFMFGVRRTAFRALATGEEWTPCYADEAVLEAFLAAASPERAVRTVQLAPGDPESRLSGSELLVQVGVEPGLDQDEVGALLLRLQHRWAADELIVERVDSISLRLERA